MVKDIHKLLKENEKLIQDNLNLQKKLTEASEVIESIKKGNIDAVYSPDSEFAKVLVAKTADHAYRKFIENMSEGVVTIHSDGIIVYSNSTFAAMINKPLEKVLGSDIRNFIPSEYTEIFELFFTENSGNNSKVELSLINSKRERTHFSVSLNKLQLQDFEAINLVWTDVTFQKKAEERLMTVNKNLKSAIADLIFSEDKVIILNDRLKENIKILEEANTELSTFAHIASHDMQEPLRKIITYSGMLTNDYFEIIDERGRKYIKNMQVASSRMRDLINDILEYSQLSPKEFSVKRTNLQAIVTEILSTLEIVINETNAKITIEKELPIIEANSSQMRQLFQNLISNSLKFIKDGRVPKISITYVIIKGNEIQNIDKSMFNDKFYKFYIRDNGIGFNQEYINKIFTIFQRLHNNSAYPGTGIGLAICKKIVEKHSGFITAESKLNEGTLFTIILPVSQSITQKHKQKISSQYERIVNT